MYTVFFFAQKNFLLREGKELWSLFTSIFIHADERHLLNNMVSLLIFGTTMEKMFTTKQFLGTYLISGLIGSLFSLLLLPAASIGLGASGAIYGIMGCVILFIPRNNPFVIIFMIFFLVSSFIFDFGNWAHLFGFLAGFGIGFVLKKRKNKQKFPKSRQSYSSSSNSTRPVGFFSKLRSNSSLRWARLKDRTFMRKERKMAKKMMNEHENPMNSHEIGNKIYAERFYLLKFRSLFLEIHRIPTYEVARHLNLTEDALFHKMLIWKMRLPFKILGNFIEVPDLAQFNLTLDAIIIEWEQKN